MTTVSVWHAAGNFRCQQQKKKNKFKSQRRELIINLNVYTTVVSHPFSPRQISPVIPLISPSVSTLPTFPPPQRCVGRSYRSPARWNLYALWHLTGIQGSGLSMNCWTLPESTDLRRRERTERVGGKAKECYWTISPPRSIVGGSPKLEYTESISASGSQREGETCVCVSVCVCVMHVV